MIFKNFIDKDLGQVSYVIGDDKTKEVCIIDPRRDIEEYIDYIEQNDLQVKYILNTHTHADYIGGHLEMVSKYPDAKNIFQKDVPSNFDFIKVKDGDIFNLGNNLSLKVIETPGHTPFCISIIINEDDVDKYIFTGDILFVGDIARPDLLGEENLMSLAEQSYETANRLYEMPNDMMMFTSHIKGSLCGKNLKSQFFSTIGIEKKTNYSFGLCKKSKKEYIDNLIGQSLETPSFFKKMAMKNIEGPVLLKNLNKIITLESFDISAIDFLCSYIIDIRDIDSFQKGHIKNSISMAQNSNVSLIAGSLLNQENFIYLVGDEKSDFNSFIIKLRRVGFDNIVAVFKNIDSLPQLVTSNKIKSSDYQLINLDTSCIIQEALNVQISEVENLALDDKICYKISCQNGYKSMAVVSYLGFLGYKKITLLNNLRNN